MSVFLKKTKKYKQIMKKYKLIIYFSTFFHPLEKIFIYLLPICLVEQFMTITGITVLD
jgi:hypothetical protein